MVVNIREKILSYVVKEKVTENEMHVREKPFLSRSKIRSPEFQWIELGRSSILIYYKTTPIKF